MGRVLQFRQNAEWNPVSRGEMPADVFESLTKAACPELSAGVPAETPIVATPRSSHIPVSGGAQGFEYFQNTAQRYLSFSTNISLRRIDSNALRNPRLLLSPETPVVLYKTLTTERSFSGRWSIRRYEWKVSACDADSGEETAWGWQCVYEEEGESEFESIATETCWQPGAQKSASRRRRATRKITKRVVRNWWVAFVPDDPSEDDGEGHYVVRSSENTTRPDEQTLDDEGGDWAVYNPAGDGLSSNVAGSSVFEGEWTDGYSVGSLTSPPSVRDGVGEAQSALDAWEAAVSMGSGRWSSESSFSKGLAKREVVINPNTDESEDKIVEEVTLSAEASVVTELSEDGAEFDVIRATKDSEGSPILTPGFYWNKYDADQSSFVFGRFAGRFANIALPFLAGVPTRPFPQTVGDTGGVPTQWSFETVTLTLPVPLETQLRTTFYSYPPDVRGFGINIKSIKYTPRAVSVTVAREADGLPTPPLWVSAEDKNGTIVFTPPADPTPPEVPADTVDRGLSADFDDCGRLDGGKVPFVRRLLPVSSNIGGSIFVSDGMYYSPLLQGGKAILMRPNLVAQVILHDGSTNGTAVNIGTLSKNNPVANVPEAALALLNLRVIVGGQELSFEDAHNAVWIVAKARHPYGGRTRWVRNFRITEKGSAVLGKVVSSDIGSGSKFMGVHSFPAYFEYIESAQFTFHGNLSGTHDALEKTMGRDFALYSYKINWDNPVKLPSVEYDSETDTTVEPVRHIKTDSNAYIPLPYEMPVEIIDWDPAETS